MAIVENTNINPELVKKCRSGPAADHEAYHGICILCGKFHGRVCIHWYVLYGCGPDRRTYSCSGGYCNDDRLSGYCCGTGNDR